MAINSPCVKYFLTKYTIRASLFFRGILFVKKIIIKPVLFTRRDQISLQGKQPRKFYDKGINILAQTFRQSLVKNVLKKSSTRTVATLEKLSLEII